MPQGITNLILSALSSKDRQLFTPDLECVDLPVRRPLAHHNGRVEHVYFIDDGLGSIVANGTAQPIEVGIIGRDGFSLPNVLLGSEHPRCDLVRS